MIETNQPSASVSPATTRVLNFFWATLVIGVVFSVGIFVGALVTTVGTGQGDRFEGLVPLQPTLDTAEDDTVDMSTFWEAWNLVHERFYYELPSDTDLVYGAIRGMMGALGDRYSAFSDPDVTAILNEDNTGTFEGIGAYVEEAPGGGIYIIRVFEGGPAEKAGVEASDIIIAVDDQDVTQKFLDESLLLVRGPSGTDVKLTIYREGEDDLLEITVQRGRIEIPTVEARMIDDEIGYVALFEFNGQATSRLRSAIRDLRRQGATKLILDLRNNPGGLRSEAISVADLFLPSGVVMIQRNYDGTEQTFRADNGDLWETAPLVVLINENSASASEIVAGAIRDYERATLIGNTTFGKGSVQGLFDLSDGSQVRITIANYYSPLDITINGIGVDPDLFIEIPDNLEPGDDPQLEAAIEFLHVLEQTLTQ